MKVLVVCQHYWPEPYPLPDICEELVRRGHQVHLITDVPNYPMGAVYPGYEKGQRRHEVHGGVEITRTFTIARRHGAFFRLLNYYSFAISSTLTAKKLRDDLDVVFVNQSSPVMMAAAAFAYAKKHGKKAVLYCMDLWPASLAAGGITEKSPIYRFFNGVSRRIYRKADRILVSSRMFRDYLVEQHGVENAVIRYLPQYADTAFEQVGAVPENKNTVDLVFAGNVGAAQNLETVLEAADLLRGEKCLRWHIVGDGSELERLRAAANRKGLEQVIFHGRRPREQMPEFYSMADAMLVTLTADPFISLTLPNKVQSYMAAGKPILGAADGEIPRLIREAECGFCSKAGDAEGLAAAVRRFLSEGNCRQLGENARRYYQEHFTKACFMDTLEEELEAYAAAGAGKVKTEVRA